MDLSVDTQTTKPLEYKLKPVDSKQNAISESPMIKNGTIARAVLSTLHEFTDVHDHWITSYGINPEIGERIYSLVKKKSFIFPEKNAEDVIHNAGIEIALRHAQFKKKKHIFDRLKLLRESKVTDCALEELSLAELTFKVAENSILATIAAREVAGSLCEIASRTKDLRLADQASIACKAALALAEICASTISCVDKLTKKGYYLINDDGSREAFLNRCVVELAKRTKLLNECAGDLANAVKEIDHTPMSQRKDALIAAEAADRLGSEILLFAKAFESKKHKCIEWIEPVEETKFSLLRYTIALFLNMARNEKKVTAILSENTNSFLHILETREGQLQQEILSS